ncbi:MAG: mechanosensitive ion channel family protein [Ilumatobacteraceae bacterium]
MSFHIGDLVHWARGNGLAIVMLVTGSILLGRAISWSGTRLTGALDRAGNDGPVVNEMAKHRHALIQMISWVLIVTIYFGTTMLVLARLNVPVSTFTIPATAVGVALGFGAQRVVADLFAGFFMITERQFGFGDQIRISPPGTGPGVLGVVEEVTLRITRLRTPEGELLIIPNGEIRQVTNLSQDWARAVIDIPIRSGVDMDEVNIALGRVCTAAVVDDGLQALLLDAPVVVGVQSIGVGYFTVRVTARTLPGRQFVVASQLRSRIVTALRRDGIELSPIESLDKGSGAG